MTYFRPEHNDHYMVTTKTQNCTHGTIMFYNCNACRPSPHVTLKDIIDTCQKDT